MGFEIITTVLVSAADTADADWTADSDITADSGFSYDLTDLATVKDELSIKPTDASNDAFLQRAITQSSRAISRYCHRVFAVETLQDVLYVQRDAYPWRSSYIAPLQLSRWPLVNADSVPFSGNTHGTATVDGIASTTGLYPGLLVFASDGSLPPGTQIQTVTANAVTLTQASSTSAAVSFTTGVQVVQTLRDGTQKVLIYGTDFTADVRRGLLIRFSHVPGVSKAWESESVTAIYQAGYEEVPDDLQDACLRLVTARFRARGRDPMLMQRDQNGAAGIGTERYWVGTTPGQTGAFAPEIAEIIDMYRVPVIA